jgi:hypothetical protein
MMRRGRRATLLVGFCRLGSIVTAYAECAWVLWEKVDTAMIPIALPEFDPPTTWRLDSVPGGALFDCCGREAGRSARQGPRHARRRVFHPGRVEGRAPALLVVPRELKVVAVVRHPDGDVPDAGPGVEPAAERKRKPVQVRDVRITWHARCAPMMVRQYVPKTKGGSQLERRE